MTSTIDSTSHTTAKEGREVFRQYITRAASRGTWIPWSEFVDQAWYRLTNRVKVTDSVGAWRKARERAITEIAALGLAATVERTDGSAPLGEHPADLSGLVRFHSPFDPHIVAIPREPLCHQLQFHVDYFKRVADTHGLVYHSGLPNTPRGICGQVADYGLDAHIEPAWLDHPYTWLDQDNQPVLTAEPYSFDPAQVVKDLAELPLTVEVHPGLWNTGTTLIKMHWDCEASRLTAEHRIVKRALADLIAPEWVKLHV